MKYLVCNTGSENSAKAVIELTTGQYQFLNNIFEELNKKIIGNGHQPTLSIHEIAPLKRGINVTKLNPVDEFICSECGLIMRDLTQVKIDDDNGDEFFYEFEFNYCPKCGVKIDN